ncbi:MAG: cell division protein FtsL [Myxococcota bacterium]
MEEISYVNYSSTVKRQQRRDGFKGVISYFLFLLPMMIICAIFVSVAIVHLYIRNQVIQYSYLVPIENKKQRMLLDENKMLKSQYSVLISPSRIEKYAIEKLNMKYPEPKDIIEVEYKPSDKGKNYIGQTR